MQGSFPLRCHSNLPDSSEDNLENSSLHSNLVMGSLLNGNDKYIEKNILFVCSLYRYLKENNCTKPDVF